MINSNNESIADILKSIDEGKTQLQTFSEVGFGRMVASEL